MTKIRVISSAPSRNGKGEDLSFSPGSYRNVTAAKRAAEREAASYPKGWAHPGLKFLVVEGVKEGAKGRLRVPVLGESTIVHAEIPVS